MASAKWGMAAIVTGSSGGRPQISRQRITLSLTRIQRPGLAFFAQLEIAQQPLKQISVAGSEGVDPGPEILVVLGKAANSFSNLDQAWNELRIARGVGHVHPSHQGETN